MTSKTNILILLVLLGAVLSIVPGSKDACAGGMIANQTCDTQVWQTMAHRAQLETEREIMQNQNLIFKADSVLDYTCFDNFAAHASLNVGVLFTHTTYFTGTRIIEWGPRDPGLDHALQTVVIQSLTPYLASNFNHDYLGGRGGQLGLQRKQTRPIGSQGRNYNCDEMSKVWKVAKCLNFLHTNDFAATDGYYPFINLTPAGRGQAVDGYQTKVDIRKYPEACGGSPIPGSDWLQRYRDSRNETDFGVEGPFYFFQSVLLTAFRDVRVKVVPAVCSDPIKTGIKIILGVGDAAPYDDGVCTNPGCTFTRNGQCTTGGAAGSSNGGNTAPVDGGPVTGGGTGPS